MVDKGKSIDKSVDYNHIMKYVFDTAKVNKSRKRIPKGKEPRKFKNRSVKVVQRSRFEH